ncbi:methyltransferase domain-containing protein [Geodermatophilus sp. DSM 44513]|uniref:class I SAM-dependent methyltransferase n=1 Tax=Geodermatophilus sp. DSM 44513 TaxID=1528104 RepID=UPI00126B48FB|nr:methyltransferase domain-containing protein [Geodermatophilus sp. DSM 44513]WNV74804.1 methyltransferase domain-containing protein [Geodermatophilus sp. DSM 44513]
MTPPLDLLVVLDQHPPAVGGLTAVARDVAEGLTGRGHRVRVVTSRHALRRGDRVVVSSDAGDVTGGAVAEEVRRVLAGDPRVRLLGVLPDEDVADLYASVDAGAPPSVDAVEAVGIEVEATAAGGPAPAGDLPGTPSGSGAATAGADYAARLVALAGAGWKQRLDVQRPYRWNLRRLGLGRVLDVGCGVGRNLAHLDGNAFGVDHNPTSVAIARERGLSACTPEEFAGGPHDRPGAFDSLLLAHVVEHVDHEVAVDLVRRYLPVLRPGGRVVFICPQERGWASDPTHVRFVDDADLAALSAELGLTVERSSSFPFPRPVGRLFPHNEFVVVARAGGAAAPWPGPS